MGTMEIIFYTFLPCLVIAAVGVAAWYFMRNSPDWLRDILNFNFTNPKPRAKSKRK
jgi:hypothetical protein